eukprot:TRINITY_DN381323_c0_g1_i1.p1 TRINITY_DN381323_c0_g1~~TRINITY_DN381323_c0_g1_i1.p1  ORF type:complete len:168 (-),score=59.15 TRINITY_DN381323_c0_g1_i1:162-665(-)
MDARSLIESSLGKKKVTSSLEELRRKQREKKLNKNKKPAENEAVSSPKPQERKVGMPKLKQSRMDEEMRDISLDTKNVDNITEAAPVEKDVNRGDVVLEITVELPTARSDETMKRTLKIFKDDVPSRVTTEFLEKYGFGYPSKEWNVLQKHVGEQWKKYKNDFEDRM